MIWFFAYWVIGVLISLFDFFVISKNITDDHTPNQKFMIMGRTFFVTLFWPVFIIFYLVILYFTSKYF